MNCKNHIGMEAGYACTNCGQPLCLDCTVELNHKMYCKDCLQRLVAMKTVDSRQQFRYPRKSKFLTFLFGWIPGAGHMYLGLINKGLSLMGMYFIALSSILIISDVLYMGWFNTLIAPLSIISVAYSIFESLQICSEINSGKNITDTEALNFTAEFNLIKEKVLSRKNTIGYILVIFGCIGLLNIAADFLGRILREFFNIRFPYSFSSLLIPVLLIFGGFYLIRRSHDYKM